MAIPRGMPRQMDQPEVGWWVIRAVKGGPLVPARIFLCDHEPGEPSNKLDRWPLPFLAAEIAGKPVEIDRVWLTRGRPISENEFQFLMAEQTWLRANAPDDPLVNPGKQVRLADIPPPF